MPKQERQYQAIPEPTSDLGAMLKTLKALKQNVEVLCGMRPQVPGLADMLTDIKSVSEGITARFTQYVQVSTGDQRALARRTTTLEADMYDATGRVTSIEEASADADGALAKRIDTLDVDMYENKGRVSVVEKASVDRDRSLAERLEDVEATTGGGTADGRIAFRASAGPEGYAASYDLTLTAQATGGAEVKAGMSVLAKVDANGMWTSSIAFTASTFVLYDPSLGAMPVFNYSNNVFRFNVPVEIQTEEIARRAITVPYFSRNPGVQGGGLTLIALTITDADTLVDIIGDYDGEPGRQFPFISATQYLTLTRTKQDGSEPYEVQQKKLSFYISGNNENRSVAFNYTGMLAQDTPGVPGDYIYALATSTGNGPVSMKILAAKR